MTGARTTPRPICSTPRLLIRELCLEDAPFLVELLNDADFLRFIGDRGVRSEQDARKYLRDGPLDSYARHGHGLWLVEHLADGWPIGICGLLRREQLDAPDIGFAYLPGFRGQGYGNEAGLAVLQHARVVLTMERVLAITQRDNAASIGLLNKLGLRRTGTVQLDAASPELERFEIRLT